MKIGIIREGKTPPDSRVPLTPRQCRRIENNFDVDILVEPSENRVFENEEYEKQHFTLRKDMASCEVLMGVKEVPIENLIPNKTYFFFSHTIKAQVYNRKLLQAVLEKNIRLIDYEVLRDDNNKRLIAFGRFAGMVGAHNAIWTYAQRSGEFQLKRMKDYKDYAEAKQDYKRLRLPALKIALTGTGRVGKGSAEVLEDMGIQKVKPKDFVNTAYDYPVFTQLECTNYAKRIDGKPFRKKDFYEHPELFESKFEPYTKVSDVMINGIYWDNNAPAFFTKEEMKQDDFSIKVIADVTCDIAPISSIPSTLRPSTIADPVFGYDPMKERETDAFQENMIDMMTIDNLPNELPRDASQSFGNQFITYILPELLKEKSKILEQATIAENGDLGKHFEYLRDFVEGK